MNLTSLLGSRRRTAFTTAAAICTTTLVASLTTATALPGTDGDGCPQPYPVDELVKGLEAEGLTVEQGTEPEPFDATVVGVIDGGIAPGIDMILVETESPAIERAGGIWSGMSGSPVYADDGRLLGAVAYGLSQSPSNIAGLTPAADMYQLLDHPEAASAHTTSETQLPEPLQDTLVKKGAATPDQAQAGMSALPLPLAVSGLSADRLTAFSENLQEHLPGARAYTAGAADVGAESRTSDIVPGGNMAAALSYGDVTSAGVGTTTVVCDDTALGFGHPFQWSGQSQASVHPAEAVLVQRDDVAGSFKVANPLGAVGTLDQDRQAGIRAMLGSEPTVTPVTSTVTAPDAGTTREGTTHVTADTVLADLAGSHLLANVDRAFDAIGPGTADLRWVIEGTRASGEPFTLDVENTYSSQFDIAFETVPDAIEQIRAIQQNELEDAQITSIDYEASVSSTFEQYSISSVEVRLPDGTYQAPPESAPMPLVAGSELAVRLNLTPYKNLGDAEVVDLTIDVPDDAAGGYGWVDLTGGAVGDEGDGGGGEGDDADDESPESPAQGNGFDGLLEELDGLVPNNSATATLSVEQETGAGFNVETWSDRQIVDQVVSGSRSFQVEIVE